MGIQPQTLGAAMRLVGRYLDDDIPGTAGHAIDDLRAAYEQWRADGGPEHGTPSGPVAAAEGVPGFHSRGTDPSTSDDAADRVTEREGGTHLVRPGTHKGRLLLVYGRSTTALSDHAAAEQAGLGTGGWKRCSDLRRGGYIAQVGTTTGPNGTDVMTCDLTDKGLARWREIEPYAQHTYPHRAERTEPATLFD